LPAKCESASEVLQQVAQSKADIIFGISVSWTTAILLRLKESGYYPIVICIAGKAEQEKKETERTFSSYLNRPLSFERFHNIMNKIKDYLSTTIYIQHARNNRFVFIKSEYKIIKVRFEDILFCEGMKDYTQVYLKGKTDPILTLNNFKIFLLQAAAR